MFALVFLLFAGVSSTRADEVDDAVAKAILYLKGQVVTPDITMALVAAGESVDVEYLKNFSGDSAISYAKPIMALAAAARDPRTFPNEDFVAKMKSFADGAQLGSADQIKDDIWWILALASAGVPTADSVFQSSKAFLLNNHNNSYQH